MRKILQYILKLFASAVLAKYRPKIIAITGSVGKTSAKETIFVVLETKFPGKVRRSLGNFNTEIGAPLTIIGGIDAQRSVWSWLGNFLKALRIVLSRDRGYPDVLVLEMAADKPGDIIYLTSFIHPDIAVVTAIGEMPSHLEFFPELDIYISEKANIIKNLKPGGIAILNYDDLSVRELRNTVPTSRERFYYGFQEGAEVRLENFSYKIPIASSEINAAGIDFKVFYENSEADFHIAKTLGAPPLYAALAAVAVGIKFGLDLKQTAEALKNYIPPKNRLEIIEGIKETIIINDSYNSSPLAAEAALGLLAEFKKNRKIAVLGSMRELGINTEPAHRRIGQKAAKICDVVFLVGDEMVFAQEEILKKKFVLGQDVFWFETSDEAKIKVQEILQPGDAVLIKGSRGVRMENIVEEIKAL
ncbi:MAG: UDP-N-acetylmuramoyl-tripeptide--D-alanyl-D-alanine ligase [Patescibacteria group bacterium]